MASSIRAKQIIEGPPPLLQVGPYHTESVAIQCISYSGALIPWNNSLRSVQSTHLSQKWARCSKTPSHANGPHTLEPVRVHIGDKHGLQGCFQQAIGHALGAALEAKSVNLYFGDFKCSGSDYQNIPDVVALQDGIARTSIKLIGELKVPWVAAHDLHTAAQDEDSLRRKVAQPVRDMQQLGCEYGFISTYEHTIFLRQFQSPGGRWEVWYSPPISSLAYYAITTLRNQGTQNALPQVSMKQCMFYVCSLASMSRWIRKS